MTQDEIGLFTVSAFFGLGFSGLVPAYVLALREFFPVRDALWRVPTLLLFSGCGMAAGAWIGGPPPARWPAIARQAVRGELPCWGVQSPQGPSVGRIL